LKSNLGLTCAQGEKETIFCDQFDDNLIPNYQSFKYLVSSCH
jgi:hypothetical protein